MKISLEWLKEYVDYNDSVERLEEILTHVGFPVEGREQVGDDWMLDVEVTSNRPDCLGHIGLAREVAAATGAEFRMPNVDFPEEGKPVTDWTSVEDEASDLCARYTARVIDQVKVGPSPDWMVRRLETIGLRGISNVVDITNYVLMEIGQPLHSFDYHKLQGGRIVVRRARQGEIIETIDQSKMELKDDMLVIADAAVPVALAGVMGGLASEVNDDTSVVLLESAHFNSLSIRRTSRALTLASESSFRFERNVDFEMVEWASRRASALLAEMAGGKVAPGVIDVAPGRQERENVSLRLSRLNMLVGITFESQYVVDILKRLGFQPDFDGTDIITCCIPSWRGDVSREADLIEEIIRIHGFDHVPTESKIHIIVKTPDGRRRTQSKVSQALIGCGFFEAINVSFIEDKFWKLFAQEGFEPVRVKDLSRRSNNALRQSVLPSLLSTGKRNQDVGNGPCECYELAAVYHPTRPGELPDESIQLGLMTDRDFRRMRGVIEAVMAILDRDVQLTCKPAEILWAAPGTGAQLLIGEKCVGRAGNVKPEIIKEYDLNNDICMAEVTFDELVQLEGKTTQLKPLSRFPASIRDLSVVIDEQITWARLEEVILQLNLENMRTLSFVGIFRGKGVPAGKKSLTLSMEFRCEHDTLRREQVDEYMENVLSALKEKFQAELRT
ncbi:MAG: phenylalanine--tRNA ligase subunit beta [Sedimentisphaerales bacterium]|nr:phenylalanine--tRNA ligase subunit beta [Sedimentisphaerales bacterium]